MTGLSISKPWIELTEDAIAALPAQLGVFEIADGDETVLLIGYAGGREPFGLRSALTAAITAAGVHGDEDEDQPRRLFRHELTHAYLTRWEELLMVYKAVNGRLPAGNAEHPHRLGRLTVDDQ